MSNITVKLPVFYICGLKLKSRMQVSLIISHPPLLHPHAEFSYKHSTAWKWQYPTRYCCAARQNNRHQIRLYLPIEPARWLNRQVLMTSTGVLSTDNNHSMMKWVMSADWHKPVSTVVWSWVKPGDLASLITLTFCKSCWKSEACGNAYIFF